MGWVLQTAPVALEVFCLASQRVSKIWVWNPGKPASPVYQISHHSLLSLAQPVHSLALTLYPSRHLDLRPLLQTLKLLELSVLCYKKLPQMRVSFFFFFSVSASNRVIHMSNCSLPLCFVYQTSYGMTRKVRDWWDLFWKKLWRRRCQTGMASAASKSWVEALLIGPQAPNKVS